MKMNQQNDIFKNLHDKIKDEKKFRLFFSSERHNFDFQKTKYLNTKKNSKKYNDIYFKKKKTSYVILLLCLNLDFKNHIPYKRVFKSNIECWIDTKGAHLDETIQKIGNALENQYKNIYSKATYIHCLDPSIKDIKRECEFIRKSAVHDRVVVHYNGHGVPPPSERGEIWIYNKKISRFRPLLFREMLEWVRYPSLFILDIDCAGVIIDNMLKFHKEEDKQIGIKQIMLAPCSSNEYLPIDSFMPNDLFTSCLTTPLKMALIWHHNKSKIHNIDIKIIDDLPGSIHNRKTLLGQLYWIYTSIVDSIAWNLFIKDFYELFRQDNFVAGILRNYLLAERIFKSFNRTPRTYPLLPATNDHYMWDSWDLIVDFLFCQIELNFNRKPLEDIDLSSFFTQQITAFENWLSYGTKNDPPINLPILLQVLLSQLYRKRALGLLARFLDKGTWAVNLAISVGIIPYILKLFRTFSVELREVLIFVWAKICVVDDSIQHEISEKCFYYENLIKHINTPDMNDLQIALSVFILACVLSISSYQGGKSLFINLNGINTLYRLINGTSKLVKFWAILCLSSLCKNSRIIKQKIFTRKRYLIDILIKLLDDNSSKIRAATTHVLGIILKSKIIADSQSNLLDINIAHRISKYFEDGSPLVRIEVISSLGVFITLNKLFFSQISQIYKLYKPQNPVAKVMPIQKSASKFFIKQFKFMKKQITKERSLNSNNLVTLTNYDFRAISNLPMLMKNDKTIICNYIWQSVLIMCTDPFPAISDTATYLERYISSCIEDLKIPNSISSPDIISMKEDVNSEYSNNDKQINTKNHPTIPKLKSKRHSIMSWEPSETNIFTWSKNSFSNPLLPIDNFIALSKMNKNILSLNFLPYSPLVPTKHMVDGYLELKPFKKSILESIYNLIDKKIPIWEKSHTYVEYGSGSDKSVFSKYKHINNNSDSLKHINDFYNYKKENKTHYKINTKLCNINTNSKYSITKVLLHSYMDYLIIGDENGWVHIWDINNTSRLNTFSNLTNYKSIVTDMHFINDIVDTMILIASDDGCIRIWKDIESSENIKLVSAFNGLNDFSLIRKANIVTSWNNTTGELAVTGYLNMIRIWDVDKEKIKRNLFVPKNGIDSQITSLFSDNCETNNHILCAGGNDGNVYLYDLREKEPLICKHKCHRNPIINLYLRNGYKLITFAKNEGINISDNRYKSFLAMKNSIDVFNHFKKPHLFTASAHSYLNMFACGYTKQSVKLYNYNGKEINNIRFRDGFITNKIGCVTALNFHRFKPILAVGEKSGNSFVYINSEYNKYSLKRKTKRGKVFWNNKDYNQDLIKYD